MNDLGSLIKERRKNKKLTLAKLGELTDVTHGHLSNIENGSKTPSPELIKKIAPLLESEEDVGMNFYAGMLEAAGYNELAEAERLKSAYEDFGDEYSIVKLHQRNRALEKALELKNLMGQKGIPFQTEELKPRYNGHLLTEQDQERILKMLELLFPEYQVPAKADI